MTLLAPNSPSTPYATCTQLADGIFDNYQTEVVLAAAGPKRLLARLTLGTAGNGHLASVTFIVQGQGLELPPTNSLPSAQAAYNKLPGTTTAASSQE